MHREICIFIHKVFEVKPEVLYCLEVVTIWPGCFPPLWRRSQSDGLWGRPFRDCAQSPQWTAPTSVRAGNYCTWSPVSWEANREKEHKIETGKERNRKSYKHRYHCLFEHGTDWESAPPPSPCILNDVTGLTGDKCSRLSWRHTPGKAVDPDPVTRLGFFGVHSDRELLVQQEHKRDGSCVGLHVQQKGVLDNQPPNNSERGHGRRQAATSMINPKQSAPLLGQADP